MSESRPSQEPTERAAAASPAPPKPSLNGVATSPFALDVPRLHSLPSEQQGLYLLTFTAGLTTHAGSLDADGASAEQAILKKELLQIVNLSSPSPTRVIRNNLGRCFADIFSKGNRKLLYESINDLVAIIGAGKEKDVRSKHTAVSCLGSLFEAAGDSAQSLSSLGCMTLSKAFKTSPNDTGLRSSILLALGKIQLGIKALLDEDVARSIWKQARNAAASDKSLLVQSSACWCLEQFVRCTPYFDNSNDFERLQATLFKTFESPSATVRHAGASCLAAELGKSHAKSPNKDMVPHIRKPRKARKTTKGEDLDEELDRAASPAPDKPATALSFSLVEMLRTLSVHYCRPTTTNRGRAGVMVCYIKLLKTLGESVVEESYGDIAGHLFTDILSHPSFQFNKYRQLMTRKFVRIILEKTVGRMLGETAQLNSCRFLLNEIIKDYPQAVKERPEPNKHTLVGAISALTSLIRDLDASAGSIAELCREALLQVLQHPNFTVQVYAARAMKGFVFACPQQLLPTVTICMNSVSRELTLLTGPRQGPKRCIGYAHGLAAVLSTSSQHPLYGSVDVYARVLQQATTLLKSSGGSDLRISSCQLQVAWIMIGGLMSLGPTFVKIHLSQLMLLWKNALPRPVPSENMSQRNMIELSYLAHVRECALGSIRAFLTFNRRLLTSDISRRLSSMLESTVAFLQSLPDKKTSDDPSNRLSPALQLHDYELMVQRRVFQCFSQLLTLSPVGSLEMTAHSTLLPLAVAAFSDPDHNPPSSLSAAIASAAAAFESIWDAGDNYGFGVTGLGRGPSTMLRSATCRSQHRREIISQTHLATSSLSAAIASAAAAFESIWDAGDNYGFGVTGLVQGLDVQDPVGRNVQKHWTSRESNESFVDQTILSPVGTGPEYDATFCYLPEPASEGDHFPNAPGTESINAAITVFGLCLPLQEARVQESMLEQILSSLGASSLQKDPARKAAVTVNVALALVTACKVANGEIGSAKGSLRRDPTEKALQNLLHICIRDQDVSVRRMAADALGRLCCSSGTAFTAPEVQYLTETIVNNREPHVRAGCALALASIHSQLGGMAAGFHMKTIVGILMSLAADTHPQVHFWALDSLAQVAESAGLNFSAHVTSSIGMLSQLYVSDGHNNETSTLASSNMSMELLVPAAIARGVDSAINVLGPDLQHMARPRDMILTLVGLFSKETEVAISLESLRCQEHLSMYAPEHVGLAEYVQRLQTDVESINDEISSIALYGLATLMRRNAIDIVKIARPGLEERLWDCLNKRCDQPSVKNIFTNWLHQTGTTDPAEWIQRCNNILTKTAAKSEQPKTIVAKQTPGPDLQDEEVAGFAVTAGASKEDDTTAPTSTQELMRWQVRLFAMNCLHDLIAFISKDAAVSDEVAGEAVLQQKVADVVKIAFSASTAGVAALRVVGMRIIDQILKLFGRTADPDFPEAMLLEQYQAQISSALTPAFAADSSPELAAAAVSVCATFIATGIVTDIDRMGRILKVLVSALDSFSRETESASIGDLKALSSNAQVMVRMAVFSAWAELQIASDRAALSTRGRETAHCSASPTVAFVTP
nr:heat repeat-containing protein 5b [Quercus suber]